MTQLYMQQAARAAGAQSRTIAVYAATALPSPAFSPLLLSAAFSAFLWALVLTRAVLQIS